MSEYDAILGDVELPELIEVRQLWRLPAAAPIRTQLAQQLDRPGLLDGIGAGAQVAIAVGSRGIDSLRPIVAALVARISRRGAQPFVVPAMGSHGGATAEGQVDVLRRLGITEKSVRAPIRSSMETVRIGTTAAGVPVYMDRHAMAADAIILVGRIKPHTDFRGDHESGLGKMIAIGLGKQRGASTCHQQGMDCLSGTVRACAEVALRAAPIAFGVAILENALHHACKVVALERDCILAQEPLLLAEARQNMARIPLSGVDVLVVGAIGKEISGASMDPHVTGRSGSLKDLPGPNPRRIVALDLTRQSHGNANGVGLADVITRRLYRKIDLAVTYPNALTSTDTNSVMIPMTMPTDELAVRAALKTCGRADGRSVRLVWIANTLDITRFYISPALLDEVRANPDLEVCGGPRPVPFDGTGTSVGLFDKR